MRWLSTLALLLAACSASPSASGTARESGDAPAASAEAVRDAAAAPGAAGASQDDGGAAKRGGGREAEDAPPRVVVIGASVSAGYGTFAELDTRLDLDLCEFARAFLPAGDDAVRLVDISERWFFVGPRHHGPRLVTEAARVEPDAVVALDFLFWYAFGPDNLGDRRRSWGLEEGLSVLGRLEVPLVVGDLPNIDQALRGEGPGGAPIVNRSLIPTEEERLRMNARIRAWAGERDDVALVSLEAFTADAVALESFALRGNRWQPESLRDVLQPDLLHPTTRGMLWVALAALDALEDLGVVDDEEADWDVDAARERLQAVVEPLRRTPREGATGR